MHSVAGCTGSGLGSFLFPLLKDYYPTKEIYSFSLYSANVPYPQTYIYNSILAQKNLSEDVDAIITLSNEQFHHILIRCLKLQPPFLKEMNGLTGIVTTGVTSSLRQS